MAKMNKSEAVEAAKNMARRHPRVTVLSLDDLGQMNWKRRLQVADECLTESAVEQIDTHARYMPDCREAFKDAALSLWGRKEKEIESKRQAWKRASTGGIDIKAAQTKLVDLLRSMNIRGMRFSEGYFSAFEVSRADAQATLYVRFDREYLSDSGTITNPDNEQQRAGVYTLKVDISWGGTSRTLSDCEVSLKLYRELVDAGHEIVSTFERQPVRWTYGIEEPKAEPVVESISLEAVVPGC